MKIRTIFRNAFVLGILLVLSACGGGENASSSKVLAVKLHTVGSFSSPIAAVEAKVTLPAGVTLRADSIGAPLAGVVVASGNAVGTTLLSGVKAGVLTIGIIPNTTTGGSFSAGEFATLYCDVPVASTVAATDFAVVGTLSYFLDAQNTTSVSWPMAAAF